MYEAVSKLLWWRLKDGMDVAGRYDCFVEAKAAVPTHKSGKTPGMVAKYLV